MPDDLFTPIGYVKKSQFEGWSDAALDAYIIMTRDQVSASMFPQGRERFESKLSAAEAERARRNALMGSTATHSVYHSDVVMNEEVGRTYMHAMSGSSGPKTT